MKKLAMAVVAAMGVVCSQAEAAVYTLQNVQYGQPTTSDFLGYNSVSLSVSEAAVRRGSFNLSYNNGRAISGDLADFISFQVPYDGVYATTLNRNEYVAMGYGSISAGFDPSSGAITSIRVNFIGISTDISFGGSASMVSGSFSSDAYGAPCSFQPGKCTFTAQFVPEPETWLLLLVPVAAFGLVRSRGSDALKLT